MALKAGRVGVAPKEVDAFGNIIGGSGGGYTKEEVDAKLLLKEDASKIGGLEFRNNSGTAQYKIPGGDWINFSSGGVVIEDLNITNDYVTSTHTIPTESGKEYLIMMTGSGYTSFKNSSVNCNTIKELAVATSSDGISVIIAEATGAIGLNSTYSGTIGIAYVEI